MVDPHDLLILERSKRDRGLWRFGRADEPGAIWGLIARNEIGGVEVTHPQGEGLSWRDDRATALSLVAMRSDEERIEYDLSWRPIEGPLYVEQPTLLGGDPEHRETLGERAERLRRVGDSH